MTEPTSIPNFPPPGGEHPVRGLVLDALLDEGLMPGIDQDGDVAVTVQGQRLFLRCVDTMPALVRVLGLWLLDERVPADELTRLRAANGVTSAINLVKVTVHEDRLTVAVDLTVADGRGLRPLLRATFDAVLGAARTWYVTVAELTGAAGDGDQPGRAAPTA